MQTGIHPVVHATTFTCGCGKKHIIQNSTIEDMHIEICSDCHPFYTGKEKLIDTAGRVDKFRAKEAAAKEA